MSATPHAPVGLVADSTCDLPEEERRALSVSIVPLHVMFEGRSYLDGVDLTTDDILAGVAAGADLPSTGQGTPEDFASAFRAAADAGAREVLCITMSSELSGTFASASTAARDAPVPVTVFDSRATTAGHGDVVRAAATLRDGGASVAAIVRRLEPLRDSLKPLFAVTNLEFLRKGGRIGRASALLGGLLRLTPILTHEGAGAVPLGTVRGTSAAVRALVRHAQAFVRDHSGTLGATFMHVHNAPAAERLASAMREAGLAFVGGATYGIGTAVATHVGPGTFGVYLRAEP